MRNNFNNAEEILLSAITGKSREFLIAHPEIKMTKSQLLKLSAGRKKLRAGYPLAYLLGYKWFFGTKFAVNKSVLIPRPETELLVEKALAAAKKLQPKMIIDVGTGSGAIIVSLRKNLKSGKFYGTDISVAALKVAKANAKKLKIKFLRGNLLTPLFKTLQKNPKNILICANLPYLSKTELREPSIKHEPKLALYAGTKSTDKIVGLLQQIKKLRLSQSQIFLEIGYSQASEIKKLAKKYLPAARLKIYKDLSGFDRLVQIWI